MADKYSVGDLRKLLKKLSRKKTKKQKIDKDNNLYVLFEESDCCGNNKYFYRRYLKPLLSADEGSSVAETNSEGDAEEDDNSDEKMSDDEADEETKDDLHGSDVEDDGGQPKTTTTTEKFPKDNRTVFVGNIPKTIEKKRLKQTFLEFGPIQTIRIRSLAPAQQGISKQIIGKTMDLNARRDNYNAYIVFEKEEAAHRAIEMNGEVFEGNHLRVDLTSTDNKTQKVNSKKSVFLGGLPFGVKEEDVRAHFKDFGELESVRLVRDPVTGMGKGFGFLVFKDQSSVALALKINTHNLNGRRIRVKPIESGGKQQNKSSDSKRMSNTERRLNQKSVKRIRYKKKLSKKSKETSVVGDKPPKKSFKPSDDQQKTFSHKTFNKKRTVPESTHRNRDSACKERSRFGGNKRGAKKGIQPFAGKKTKFE